jgi:hypothetical protein
MDIILRSQLINAFDNIRQKLQQLSDHILVELTPFPIWLGVEGEFIQNDIPGETMTVREKAARALSYFKYEPGQSAQETFSCPAVIAATMDTLLLIEAVNQAKDDFKAVVMEIKKIVGRAMSRSIQDSLAQHGQGVVKLRQVYRHLHYVNYHPVRIAWTKGRNCSNKILTTAQAKEKLLALGLKEGGGVAVELTKLGELSESEPLIQHYPVKPHWQVNISRVNEDGYSVTQNIKNSLPFFYVHQEKREMPLVEYADKRPRRVIRANKLIAEEPYLRLIHAYSYRQSNNKQTCT